MPSALHDFRAFVHELYQSNPPVPEDVRRLASLCLNHFDTLSRTTRHQSQRSIRLVSLMRAHWAQQGLGAPEVGPIDQEEGEWSFQRLHSMRLGPFRGFRNQVEFELNQQLTLVYGPNGSGKSSLCEALEYALLGAVDEAEAKRIQLPTYLRNIHEGRFVAPELQGSTPQGPQQVPVDAERYRFCFVEKNRIDTFSRLAARPAGQRGDLIATLFGMEPFNLFVSHFNGAITQQLTLTADKAQALNLRRQALAADEQRRDQAAASRSQLEQEEALLAEQSGIAQDYATLKQTVGTPEHPGRLLELDERLTQQIPAVIGLTSEHFVHALDTLQREQRTLTELNHQWHQRSEQVSFKGLYQALLALREQHGDHCPACDTPLTNVTRDPYIQAEAGLAQLLELVQLETQRDQAKLSLQQAARELRGQMHTLLAFMTTDPTVPISPSAIFLQQLSTLQEATWWTPLFDAANKAYLDALVDTAKQIDERDETIRQQHGERIPLLAERQRLQELYAQIQVQDGKRSQFETELAAALQRIAAFNDVNAPLVEEVRQERLQMESDGLFNTAYNQFLQYLRQYREQLPARLMAGISEAALGLYNDFNRHDHEHDLLAALRLPVTGNDVIELAFRGQPERFVDALQVLSEGHIRCLGLAILIAKAQSINTPLIIFDDVLNAIDHDHRSGIRATLFEDERFLQTQFIVTCHSNEFIKDIQNNLPPARQAHCKLYLLDHHLGDHQPRVRGGAPRGYLLKARAACLERDHRSALTACRQALEHLTRKIWGWLGNHDLGALRLELNRAGGEPGLRDLCDTLRARLNAAAYFTHDNKAPLLAHLNTLLGIPQTTLTWTYLNKGVHDEERDDFDAVEVESVVRLLEALDAMSWRAPRRG